MCFGGKGGGGGGMGVGAEGGWEGFSASFCRMNSFTVERPSSLEWEHGGLPRIS